MNLLIQQIYLCTVAKRKMGKTEEVGQPTRIKQLDPLMMIMFLNLISMVPQLGDSLVVLWQ